VAHEELLAMTEDELFEALGVAPRAECRAIAKELALFGYAVPDDAETAARIDQAEQRQLAIEEELNRRR
jgi:hypothetical protein